MSKTVHTHNTSSQSEHGTTSAYIVGFILSLIFTIIPYYLVVTKIVSGNALLAIILGIAVWQMAIQLVFFLHLGRGPKPLYNIVFFFATAGVILLTIGASLFIMSNLYRNMSPEESILKQAQEEGIAQIGGRDTGACNELKKNHTITIKNNIATPVSVQAQRCDTLTFVNDDEVVHEIGFGTYPGEVSYGGLDKVVVSNRRPEIITLNQLGNFTFSDYQNASVGGSFFVIE